MKISICLDYENSSRLTLDIVQNLINRMIHIFCTSCKLSKTFLHGWSNLILCQRTIPILTIFFGHFTFICFKPFHNLSSHFCPNCYLSFLSHTNVHRTMFLKMHICLYHWWASINNFNPVMPSHCLRVRAVLCILNISNLVMSVVRES